MLCLECNKDVKALTNQHLMKCCGLTLQEYALRHCIPLDILLDYENINNNDERFRSSNNFSDARKTQVILTALDLTGKLRFDGTQAIISGDIRTLDRLLWYQKHLDSKGFEYMQEYSYKDGSHRVVAHNILKSPNIEKFSATPIANLTSDEFLFALSIIACNIGFVQASYLFFSVNNEKTLDKLFEKLKSDYKVSIEYLGKVGKEYLYRCKSLDDTEKLFGLIKKNLSDIPNTNELFFMKSPKATVVKELSFDSAHFITDHSDKCSNLHGGRYVIRLKVCDRINPTTGFVMDYKYLKCIAKDKIVDVLDHHNINYLVPQLSWRSSTELMIVYIWESLINYLPSLAEIQINETEQSYCVYNGPTLGEYQANGSDKILQHFLSTQLGLSESRKELYLAKLERLQIVNK